MWSVRRSDACRRAVIRSLAMLIALLSLPALAEDVGGLDRVNTSSSCQPGTNAGISATTSMLGKMFIVTMKNETDEQVVIMSGVQNDPATPTGREQPFERGELTVDPGKTYRANSSGQGQPPGHWFAMAMKMSEVRARFTRGDHVKCYDDSRALADRLSGTGK